MRFGAFWEHQVIKSWTENRHFSAPLLKVGRDLPSLSNRSAAPAYLLLLLLLGVRIPSASQLHQEFRKDRQHVCNRLQLSVEDRQHAVSATT